LTEVEGYYGYFVLGGQRFFLFIWFDVRWQQWRTFSGQSDPLFVGPMPPIIFDYGVGNLWGNKPARAVFAGFH
jgi:hypothetical protein